MIFGSMISRFSHSCSMLIMNNQIGILLRIFYTHLAANLRHPVEYQSVLLYQSAKVSRWVQNSLSWRCVDCWVQNIQQWPQQFFSLEYPTLRFMKYFSSDFDLWEKKLKTARRQTCKTWAALTWINLQVGKKYQSQTHQNS